MDKPSAANPSKWYLEALAEAKAHHASSKTYSGSFLRPHAPFIKEIIDAHGIRSILDYGCGKGRQYEWRATEDNQAVPKGMTLEEYWGVPVTKYDPAWPPFEAKPAGTFDLVICTHTIGAIPCTDLAWVLGEIETYADRGIYYAEKIGDVRKEVFSQPGIFPRGYTRDLWTRLLRPHRADLELLPVWLATREARPDGEVITERGRIA